MKKNNEQIEDATVQRLLSHASLDELIKMKMEEEIQQEFEKTTEVVKTKVMSNISEVPVDLIFSKRAVYKLFNRTTKVQTYINGVQAEAMLGLQNAVRSKILTGTMDAFSTEHAYVKFEKVEI